MNFVLNCFLLLVVLTIGFDNIESKSISFKRTGWFMPKNLILPQGIEDGNDFFNKGNGLQKMSGKNYFNRFLPIGQNGKTTVATTQFISTESSEGSSVTSGAGGQNSTNGNVVGSTTAQSSTSSANAATVTKQSSTTTSNAATVTTQSSTATSNAATVTSGNETTTNNASSNSTSVTTSIPTTQTSSQPAGPTTMKGEIIEHFKDWEVDRLFEERMIFKNDVEEYIDG